ncbi:MAG: carbohydrate-binding family 9-like protein [Pseudomonadota bacterium]
MTRGILVLFVAAALAATACSRPKKVLTAQQRNEVERNILEELPSDPDLVRLDANFEDKVTLLGYTLSEERVTPGDQPLTVTYYWRCDAKIDGDMKIFVHLDSSKRTTYDHYAVSGLLPTSQWEPGQIIQDVQTIDIGRGYPEGTALLWVGFFDQTLWSERQENKRLTLKDPGKGRKDKGERLLVATLWIGKGGPKSANVSRASGITIDGKLDEPGWATAMASVGPLVKVRGGAATGPGQGVKAGFLWDDERLYLAFDVEDRDVRSELTDRDSKLWTTDNVELFLRPSGAAGGAYIELQVSPANVIFDALFTGHRTPEWEKAAANLTLDVESAVVVEGILNKPGRDGGWTAEISIPFKELHGVEGPPAPGTIWTANLYRISEGKAADAVTWVPVGGDFHELTGAGRLTFVAR